MLADGFFDPNKPWFIRRASLPHWRQDGATYFVTFRLSDSLPQVKLRQLREDRDAWVRAHPNPGADDLRALMTLISRRVNRWLDQGYGSCVLADSECRAIVEESLRCFDGVRYELGEFAVAANHVHVLVRVALGWDLSQILYSWKRYTAARMMRVRRVAEAFENGHPHVWQGESFDHIVRGPRSLEKFQVYIRNHEH